VLFAVVRVQQRLRARWACRPSWRSWAACRSTRWCTKARSLPAAARTTLAAREQSWRFGYYLNPSDPETLL
jgi:hypothetical protein